MGEINKNEVKLGPSQSIILYPALTAPALVRGCGTLNIVIAGDDTLLKYCQEYSPGCDSGQELSEIALRYIHSHLILVRWRDILGECKDINQDALLRQLEGGVVRFAKGEARRSELQEISGAKNMIYPGEGHAAPVNRAGKTCRGWFLTTLEKKANTTICDQGNKDQPFGILASSAVGFLIEQKRVHLFQVCFSDITAFTSISPDVKEMWELLWLAEVIDGNGQSRIMNPGEEAFQKLFAEDVGRGGTRRENSMLAPADPPMEGTEAEKSRCANAFSLYNLGASSRDGGKFPDSPEREITNVAATHQAGRLFAPRHPVFWSNKKRLDVAMIADPHISSRQGVYKTVGARLIHGIDNPVPEAPVPDTNASEAPKDKYAPVITKAAPGESPLIGWMAHEYLNSTLELYCNHDADVVAFLGDMYDHVRNCSPIAYHNRANGPAWETTGYLWEAMSFKARYKDDYDLYPRYIDALLALEIIYMGYAKGLPVMFAAGNHEGYEDPYGVSPRVFGEENGFKGNEGIPLDHNLTFMEIIQLFGPSYHEHNGSGNFQAQNFDWLYTTFSPWKDVFITYAGKPKGANEDAAPESGQNFVILDWGRGEKYFANILLLGDTLPVAKDAIQKGQLDLIKRAGKQHAADDGISNLLLTHFTFAGYTRGKALYGDHYGKKALPLPKSREQLALKIEKSIPLKDGSSIDIGTFGDRQNDVWRIVTKHFEATLSGHTHKAGVYEISFVDREAMDEQSQCYRYIQPVFTTALIEGNDDTIPLPPNKGGTYSLVSGSCGSYNKQNLFGELGGFGFEKPQSMTLHFDDDSGRLNEARIVRAKKCEKPKLSVVVDYLWETKIRLFENLIRPIRKKNASERTMLHEEYDYLSGIIIAPGPGQPLTFRCSEKLCAYFRDPISASTEQAQTEGAADGTSNIVKNAIRFPLPGKTIKIHAVYYSRAEAPMHLGCLTLTVDRMIDRNQVYNFVTQRGSQVFTLSGSGETLARFIEESTVDNTYSPEKIMFILSVVFDALPQGELTFSKEALIKATHSAPNRVSLFSSFVVA